MLIFFDGHVQSEVYLSGTTISKFKLCSIHFHPLDAQTTILNVICISAYAVHILHIDHVHTGMADHRDE